MALKAKKPEEVREIPAATLASVGDQVRVNLIVPKTLRNQWKQTALDKDTTMTELIIEAMKIYSYK